MYDSKEYKMHNIAKIVQLDTSQLKKKKRRMQIVSSNKGNVASIRKSELLFLEAQSRQVHIS